MTNRPNKHLFTQLNMTPIDPAVLEQMRNVFKTKVLPKIKEDTKRNARNVAAARQRIVC